MKETFEFIPFAKERDYAAPDGSDIRLLPTFESGGLCHCTLHAGTVSKPVKHKTVSEIWYCISGKGVIWQKNNDGELVKEFTGGDSFTIPLGNSFQFKNTGQDPLYVIICTMPKWPTEKEEAIPSEGKW